MELPGNVDVRALGLVVFRLAAGQLVVTYLRRWFFVKWIFLGLAVVLALTRHWIAATVAGLLAAFTFAVAFVTVRLAERWSVPKKLRAVRAQLGSVKDAGVRNVRAELARAGVPITVLGLLGLVRRLAGRGRRDVPGEVLAAIGRVDLTRVFPSAEIEGLGQTLQQAWRDVS